MVKAIKPCREQTHLSEIDIATQSRFARLPQELKDMRALRLPRATTKENDQSGEFLLRLQRLFRQRDKVTAIAANTNALT